MTAPPSLADRLPAEWQPLWLTAQAAIALSALAFGLNLHGAYSPLVMQGMLTAAGLMLLPLPFFLLERLQAQHQVWEARVAPRAAWQAETLAHRQDLLLNAVVTALPAVALRCALNPATESAWQTAVAATLCLAWLASLFGTTLLTAAAYSGILASPWSAVGLAASLGLLAVGPGSFAGPIPGLMVDTPLLVGLLCAGGGLTSAGVLMLIERKLALGAVPATGRPVALSQRVARLAAAWRDRWRLIDGPGAGQVWGLIIQLPFNIASGSVNLQFFQPWGSSVTPAHACRLAFLTWLAAVSLRCADVHWRFLLAPGGLGRHRLGWQIIGATLGTILVPLLIMLVITALLFSVFQPQLPSVPRSGLPALVAAYAPPFAADLALAVGLAVWLRARYGTGNSRVWLAVWGGIGISTIVIAALLYGQPVSEVWGSWVWTRSAWHVGIELALAMCFALLANRAWQRVDLGSLMRRRGQSGSSH